MTIRKEVNEMSIEELRDLLFYMWQLDIKTVGELAEIKRRFHIKHNKSLLNRLIRLYNSDYYYRTHSRD